MLLSSALHLAAAARRAAAHDAVVAGRVYTMLSNFDDAELLRQLSRS